MTKKHVDLLLKAVGIPEHCSIFLCDRIGFITDKHCRHPEYFEDGYQQTGEDLHYLIQENIEYKFSFAESKYAACGMKRKEWVETILIPLALQLPE